MGPGALAVAPLVPLPEVCCCYLDLKLPQLWEPQQLVVAQLWHLMSLAHRAEAQWQERPKRETEETGTVTSRERL